MKNLPLLALLIAPLGCRTKDVSKETGTPETGLTEETAVEDTGPFDADGDGFNAAEDCDDADASVNPDADELCDGVDNDCDGDVDGGALDAGSWYPDADGDQYGAGDAVSACEAPDGHVAADGDCDDADPAYNPGATEEDCADPNDYNCDGSVGYADADADGWAACEDCDDDDALVNPDASEVCDGLDNDCDALIDDADDSLDASTTSRWYSDGDSDGYGDQWVEQCDQPSGTVTVDGDCDDAEAAVNPAATEVCDGVDNDCDGTVDGPDAVDAITWYMDVDGDGFGDPNSPVVSCDAPTGAVADSSDCDDTDATAFPGAVELQDARDTDCDGTIDESVVALIFSMQCLDNSGSTSDSSATLTAAESAALQGWLADMSLGVDTFNEASSGWVASNATLTDYESVLYTKCGWAWSAANQSMLDALLAAQTAGVGTFLFGDDMVWHTQNVSGLDPVLLMTNAGSNGEPGTVQITGTHDAVQGPYGTPTSFAYGWDMDETAAWGGGETVLATHSEYGGPVWAAHEDSSGQRASCFVGNFSATNHGYHPSSATAQLELMFKNTVAWVTGL